MTSVLNVTSPRTRSWNDDVDVLGHAEADDRALARLDAAPRLLGREDAAGAGVARRTAGGEHRAAIGLELLRRAEAVVGVAAGEQLVGVRTYRGAAARTGGTGPPRAADVRPLVPVEAEPAQILEDALLGLLGRALGVGVLDAEDERAVVAAREQPVEERRARVADVQLAGRAGGEADSHRPRSDGRGPTAEARSSATAWRGDRLAAADGVHAFVGLALDADASTRRCPARRRDARASRRSHP